MNEINEIKNLGNSINFAYEESFLDSEELHKINNKISEQIINLRKTNFLIAKHERTLAKLNVEHKRKFREEFFKSEAKNDTHKRIMAEIQCEQEEARIIYETQMVEELKRMAYSLRTELEAIKTLGVNIRQELKL